MKIIDWDYGYWSGRAKWPIVSYIPKFYDDPDADFRSVWIDILGLWFYVAWE